MLHKEMIEMNNGFRGFLLTAQETFLQPYYDGLKSVPPLIKEQRELLSTHQQKQKLDSISNLHDEWITYADSLISTKKDTLPESNRRYRKLFDTKLRMEVGKKLNDKISIIFATLDENEYAIRQKRRMNLRHSIDKTSRISLFLTITSILVAIISSIYFVKTISSRITKMVRFAENISKGNFTVIRDNKHDELSKLVESLNTMSETLDLNFKDLKRKNDELDQFAYVVSHDLKAPLRGISNIISWIEEDHATEISPAIEKNLNLIKGRTDRLENMINGLLDYARIGRTKGHFEKVDVKKLLLEIKELIIPDNVKLEISSAPMIWAEKSLLRQVFSNLIDNAIKYNDKINPQVTINHWETHDSYAFSVIDNGKGIESQYFDKIFQIFQTLQERDAFESTGVGLAIVKKIIEDNKGTIHVESKPGKGSAFIFTWPKPQDSNEKNNTVN